VHAANQAFVIGTSSALAIGAAVAAVTAIVVLLLAPGGTPDATASDAASRRARRSRRALSHPTPGPSPAVLGRPGDTTTVSESVGRRQERDDDGRRVSLGGGRPRNGRLVNPERDESVKACPYAQCDAVTVGAATDAVGSDESADPPQRRPGRQSQRVVGVLSVAEWGPIRTAHRDRVGRNVGQRGRISMAARSQRSVVGAMS